MKEKQGVSLIVLVITIIVMTILAGAIVLTLNNSGIIDKATDAVEQTNLATLREVAQIAWAEAYASGERTEEGLKGAVDTALANIKIDITKYQIKVTKSGVTVQLKTTQNGWVQEGLNVTNGTVVLEIGDSISYDETLGGTITNLAETEWKVLGASESGELLIISSEDLESIAFDLEEGFVYGVDYINDLSKLYAKGLGAVGSRGVEANDIDKITGYNKMQYGKGELYEYGNRVTYMWIGESEPYYTATNGLSGMAATIDGVLEGYHSDIYYMENGELKKSEFVDATEEDPVEITTITSNMYEYSVSELDVIKETDKAYQMLFGDSKNYWLATFFAYTWSFTVDYGMLYVSGDSLSGDTLEDASGQLDKGSDGERGVRVVVMLSSNIELTGSSESGWNIK